MSGASGLRPHHHTSAGDGGTITALSNPMTTLDDIIVGGASGTPARLGKGTDGQALIVDPVTHHLAWGTASAALTDHTHAATGSGATGGGATLQPGTLILPGSTSPAQTAEGSAVWDTDDDVLTVGTGATRKTFGYFGNTAPSGLGTASAGSGNEAARLTHIHGMPRLDELGAPTADVSLNTHKVTNVTNPASPQDAATKAYVDGAISGAGGLSDHGIVTYLDYQVGAAPATPASGYVRHYAKTGGHVAQKDDAGTETLLDATGGGGSSTPAPVQTVRTASAQTTNQSTTIAAAASGNRLLVCVGLLNRAITSLSCTNVTWTLVKAKVSATTHLEVWVGVVAGGSSGTTVTVNTGTNDWINTHVMELTNALTPTLGTVSEANGTTSGIAWLAGPITPTAGQLVVGALAMGGGAGAWPSFPGVNFVTAYPGDWPGSMDIAYATGQKMFYGTNASHAGDTYVVFLAPIT